MLAVPGQGQSRAAARERQLGLWTQADLVPRSA